MDNTKGKVKSFIEIKEEHATGYPHKNFKFVSVSTSCNFAKTEFDLKNGQYQGKGHEMVPRSHNVPYKTNKPLLDLFSTSGTIIYKFCTQSI